MPKIIVQICALIAVFAALAIWLQMRSASLMISSLENIVSHQATNVALLMERQFQEELSVLSLAADCIEPSPGDDALARILKELRGPDAGVSVGASVGFSTVGNLPVLRMYLVR